MVSNKADMRKHLYKLNPCPRSVNDIELSDEIKQLILKNHVYHIPVVTPINQVINYNNTINNLITNMDVIEKISRLTSHHDVKLIEFGETIENKFLKQVEGLKESNDTLGVYDALILDSNSLLEVIDQVSSLAQADCENMNVIYDKKFNKLKLFDMGKWNDLILITGITTLLTRLQECYLNPYECYLIRKIEVSSLCHQDKALIKNQLIDYYKFIGCFNIAPYVEGKNDSEIIYNQDDHNCDPYQELTDENSELPLKYLNLYNRVCGGTKASELNKIKKNVIEIIKKNCLKNVDELNKKVVALFHMDEEFKKNILPSFKGTIS